MKKQEFVTAIEEALEVEPGMLRDDLRFADVDSWDSLASLVFIALADEHLGVTIMGDQVAECGTVAELLELVSDKFTE